MAKTLDEALERIKELEQENKELNNALIERDGNTVHIAQLMEQNVNIKEISEAIQKEISEIGKQQRLMATINKEVCIALEMAYRHVVVNKIEDFEWKTWGDVAEAALKKYFEANGLPWPKHFKIIN